MTISRSTVCVPRPPDRFDVRISARIHFLRAPAFRPPEMPSVLFAADLMFRDINVVNRCLVLARLSD